MVTKNKKIILDFRYKLASAKIATGMEDHLRKAEFAINKAMREVLFEHPNSEVVFEDFRITENDVLNFGIGINQAFWDKSAEGVMFEVIVTDEKSQKSQIFSQYIDPKNKIEDRKWHDERVDLREY